ncbi:hypothetical protein DJ55_4204 [Yersinia pseudotuberculosis]|nr:hypothetical protein DJ55_4204 [Yersinia pseudotuberculosis]
MWVKTVTSTGVERPADPVTIALPRLAAGKIAMPDVTGTSRHGYLPLLPLLIKQTQRHLLSMG